MNILVLNAGSSSQKSRLYALGDVLPLEPPEPLWEADADWSVQEDHVKLTFKGGVQRSLVEHIHSWESRAAVLKQMLATLWSGPARVAAGPQEIDIVGHRVVHGGPTYRQSGRVTSEMRAAIEHYAMF